MKVERIILLTLLAIVMAQPVLSAQLSVKEGFPQQNNYIFVCGDDINATTYDWDFGDGEKLLGVPNSDVYHTFLVDGTYTVTCGAHAGNETQTATLTVEVDETSASITVADWFAQNNSYVFACEAEGFTPTSYDWELGDGHTNYDLLDNTVYHTYETTGTYQVICSATDGLHTETTTFTVEVNGSEATPSKTSNLVVADWYAQNNSYVFVCETEGFTPTGYNWYFGDGEKLLNITNDNVYHTYNAPGAYTATCQAFDDETHVGSTLDITVEENETTYYNGTVQLRVADNYPQGTVYVFVCEAEDFTPTSYDWEFGDGDKLLDINNSDVYHTFTKNGIYNVTCAGHDENTHGYAHMQVTVDSIDESNEPVVFSVQVDGTSVTHSSTVEVDEDAVFTWNITGALSVSLVIGNNTENVSAAGQKTLAVAEDISVTFTVVNATNETETFSVELDYAEPVVAVTSVSSSSSSTQSSRSGGRDKPYKWRGKSFVQQQPQLIEPVQEEEVTVEPEVVVVEEIEEEIVVEEVKEEEPKAAQQVLTGSVVQENSHLDGSIVATALFLTLLLGLLLSLVKRRNMRTA